VARCAVVPFKKGGEGGGSEYILPVATKTTLGGVKSSDEAGAIKVDSFGKMTYNAPSSTPLSAPDWETNTAYPENALVEYNDNIYICLIAHTSGTFVDDLANGKWKLVSMTLQTATSSTLGGVKSSSAFGKISVNSDGTMVMNGNPNDGTPTGTVISFFGLTPPTGYLVCDGTAYNIADYQALADHINTQFGSYNHFGGDGTTTFAVPDLRGEFLRGTGTNSHTNQGNGASVGEHQDGTMHNFSRVGGASDNRVMWMEGQYTAPNADSGLTANIQTKVASVTSQANTVYYRYTSRPTNTSVLYCIKA
jgi:microcystin-dependent protein